MQSLLPRHIKPEPLHNQFLGCQFPGHASAEEPLQDSRSVLHNESQDALLVEVAGEKGVESVVNWKLSDIQQHLSGLSENFEAARIVKSSVNVAVVYR